MKVTVYNHYTYVCTCAHIQRWGCIQLCVSSLQAKGLHFKHTDNFNYWTRAMESVGLPKIFYPITTDCYDRKNIPKVIYCIHALRCVCVCVCACVCVRVCACACVCVSVTNVHTFLHVCKSMCCTYMCPYVIPTVVLCVILPSCF